MTLIMSLATFGLLALFCHAFAEDRGLRLSEGTTLFLRRLSAVAGSIAGGGFVLSLLYLGIAH